ncbi:MAG TPA: hypothetical protein VGT61_08230 [Thermomicrobiales bacterium]|nr:hypothetical protein [Thermomicrobiales bacterium]
MTPIRAHHSRAERDEQPIDPDLLVVGHHYVERDGALFRGTGFDVDLAVGDAVDVDVDADQRQFASDADAFTWYGCSFPPRAQIVCVVFDQHACGSAPGLDFGRGEWWVRNRDMTGRS